MCIVYLIFVKRSLRSITRKIINVEKLLDCKVIQRYITSLQHFTLEQYVVGSSYLEGKVHHRKSHWLSTTKYTHMRLEGWLENPRFIRIHPSSRITDLLKTVEICCESLNTIAAAPSKTTFISFVFLWTYHNHRYHTVQCFIIVCFKLIKLL